MKMRMIALAGVAALAISSPALASDATGWYVDLSGGYDHMGQYTAQNKTLDTEQKIATDNAGLITGAWGYKFHDHLRLEGEIGYDDHSTGSEHAQVTSFLLNLAYDLPLSEKWTFSFGGGAGTSLVDLKAYATGYTMDGSRAGYTYQGFAGFAYSLRRNVDLTIDWRYRNLGVNKDYPTSPAYLADARDVNEQAWMVGIRWYPWAAPPPPPPPPPPRLRPRCRFIPLKSLINRLTVSPPLPDSP